MRAIVLKMLAFSKMPHATTQYPKNTVEQFHYMVFRSFAKLHKTAFNPCFHTPIAVFSPSLTTLNVSFTLKLEPDMSSCDYISLSLIDDTGDLEKFQCLALRPVADCRVLSSSLAVMSAGVLLLSKSLFNLCSSHNPLNCFFALISTPGYLLFSFSKLRAYILFLLARVANLANRSNNHPLPNTPLKL